MQSRNVLPPPPGALGVVELDVPDAPGERAKLLWVVPPVENCVGSCWDDGATWGTCCVGGSREEEPVEGVTLVAGALVREPLAFDPAGMEVTGADGVAGWVTADGAAGRAAEGAAERAEPEELRAPEVVWALAVLATSASISATARITGPVLGSVDMTLGSVSVR